MAIWGSEFDDRLTMDERFLQAGITQAEGRGQDRYVIFPITAEFQGLGTTRVQIQDQGGDAILPTSAAPVDLASDDPNDTAAGTGARIVLVQGLLAGMTSGISAPFFTEPVPLDGTNTVSTTNSFIRVVRLVVIDSGTSRGNVGVISAEIGGDLQMQIALGLNGVGHGISKSSHTTIPEGWTGFARSFLVTWSASQSIQVFCAQSDGNTNLYPFTAQIGNTNLFPIGMAPFQSETDIWCEAARIGGGGSDPVDFQSLLLLIRKS